MNRPSLTSATVRLLGCLGLLVVAVATAIGFAAGLVVANKQRDDAGVWLWHTPVPRMALRAPTPTITMQPWPSTSPTAARTATVWSTTARETQVARTVVSPGRPTGTPVVLPVVRKLDLPANDLVYDPHRQKIWVSVPGSAGSQGNSITWLNPVTGEVGPFIRVGSEPNKLALSDDGRYLYVGLDGAAAIQRFDIAAERLDLQFALGSDMLGQFYPGYIAVMPGNSGTVAVSRRLLNTTTSGYLAIFRDGEKLPEVPTHRHNSAISSIAFCDSPAILYGYENGSSSHSLYRIQLGPSGVTSLDVIPGLLSGYHHTITCDGGLLYSTSGHVVDPESRSLVGTYAGMQGKTLLKPDSAAGLVYFITTIPGVAMQGPPPPPGPCSPCTIRIYDQRTFSLLGSLALPDASGKVGGLARWGTDGLAFNTDSGQLFLVQSSMIGKQATVQSHWLSGPSVAVELRQPANWLFGAIVVLAVSPVYAWRCVTRRGRPDEAPGSA